MNTRLIFEWIWIQFLLIFLTIRSRTGLFSKVWSRSGPVNPNPQKYFFRDFYCFCLLKKCFTVFHYTHLLTHSHFSRSHSLFSSFFLSLSPSLSSANYSPSLSAICIAHDHIYYMYPGYIARFHIFLLPFV